MVFCKRDKRGCTNKHTASKQTFIYVLNYHCSVCYDSEICYYVRMGAGGDIVSVASLIVQIPVKPFDLSHFLHVELQLLA